MTSASKLLYSSFKTLNFSGSFPPITILSGLKKSSIAVPSLKNSGLNVISFLSIPTFLHTFSISYGGIVDFTVTTILELSS